MIDFEKGLEVKEVSQWLDHTYDNFYELEIEQAESWLDEKEKEAHKLFGEVEEISKSIEFLRSEIK